MTVQLRILNTGFCYHPEAIVIQGGRWKQTRFPATFALIEHSELGVILFDTGYTERFFNATQPFPFRLYRWVTPVYTQATESAREQLEQLGISATSVRYIFISHFHADHIAGLKDFPQATFICSRLVQENLLPLSPWSSTQAGFLKTLLPDDFSARCRYLEEYPVQKLSDTLHPFEQGIDLAGDGTLLAISLPGHHPGHYGLLCQTETGPVFLVGDACWHQRSYQDGRGPHPITTLILEDFSGTQATIQKLAQLHKTNPALRIIPTHCPEMHQALIRNRP
jgi:glyoxylase-like metal-dependent hydrolase (beta-lactamase superfamily II)